MCLKSFFKLADLTQLSSGARGFNHIPTLSLSALSREDSGEQAGMGILRYSPVVDEITAAK